MGRNVVTKSVNVLGNDHGATCFAGQKRFKVVANLVIEATLVAGGDTNSARQAVTTKEPGSQ